MCAGLAWAQDTPKARVEQYYIDVSFQPEKSFLSARAGVMIRAGEFTEALEFELNPALTILEVRDAQDRKLEFTRSGRLGSAKVLVRLAEPCNAEQSTALVFKYEGVLRRGPLDYITPEGILLRDESRWYPAFDLSAFTENEFHIGVPSRWRAITSGELLSSIGHGTGATFAWKTQQPVSSRSVVAFPERQQTCFPEPLKREEYSETRLGSACFMGSDEERGGRLAARAYATLKRYGDAFAPFTGAALRIIEAFPGQRGAIGYSAPGFLVVSEDVVKYHNVPGYAPEFLPHEIAHQWFPIEVTLARQEDGWLAEGLAEYLAYRYLEQKDPAMARRMLERALRDALEPEPLRRLDLGLRLFALEEWDVTHATLYQRGMLVFRMLEAAIGRSRVDAALRELYKRHRGRSASVTDFQKICEEIAQRDLGWFFDYFLRGTEVPEIELRRVPPAAPGEVAGEIVVRNVPPEFSVRVEMKLHTSAGEVDHSVATYGEVTPFTVTTTAPVSTITLDPEIRLLRWTEPARRNRAQRALLAELGALERAGQFDRAFALCLKATEADPEDVARNHIAVFFQAGRLRYRLRQYDLAWQAFERVLARRALDEMDTDFYHAWARVYRARIEQRRGRAAAARAEAEAGLKLSPPALDTRVAWPDAPAREISALEEFRVLARRPPPSKK